MYGTPSSHNKNQFNVQSTSHSKDKRQKSSNKELTNAVGPVPAPPPAGNAWDRPLTGTLRNGSSSIQKPTTVGSSAASVSTNTTTTVIVQEKR